MPASRSKATLSREQPVYIVRIRHPSRTAERANGGRCKTTRRTSRHGPLLYFPAQAPCAVLHLSQYASGENIGNFGVDREAGHRAGIAQASRSAVWSAAMDVGEWLRGLGLGQYEATFRDNGIDGMVLPHLTVEDLRELGVAGVGDRRRLLHQSNARPVEAHSVLAPALKGLSATPKCRNSLRRRICLPRSHTGATVLPDESDPPRTAGLGGIRSFPAGPLPPPIQESGPPYIRPFAAILTCAPMRGFR